MSKRNTPMPATCPLCYIVRRGAICTDTQQIRHTLQVTLMSSVVLRRFTCQNAIPQCQPLAFLLHCQAWSDRGRREPRRGWAISCGWANASNKHGSWGESVTSVCMFCAPSTTVAMLTISAGPVWVATLTPKFYHSVHRLLSQLYP